MRKFLLASVATLGTGGLIGAAFAQAPGRRRADAGPDGLSAGQPDGLCQQQQQLSGTGAAGCARKPYAGHHRGPRERQGADHVPELTWASARPARLRRAPAAGSLGAVLGANGTGTVKVAPYALDSFMRLYFGADAMATNGLRYGAAIELRRELHRPDQQQHQLRRQRLHLAVRRCTCAVPSPTSPARSGASSASARPTA